MFRQKTFVWRIIRLCFILFILLTQFYDVTETSAQDGSCQPGTNCLFALDSDLGKCRLNEDLFFTRTDRWEIPAGGYDYFNFRFGPFTKNNGYVSPGGWQGGCICNVATWLNYFLKVNDIKTFADAPYHKNYDIPGVPNTGTDYDKLYIVTVQHPETPKPATLDKWGYDLRVENSSSVPLVIRWQIIDDPDGRTDYVSIWLEDVVTVMPTPTTPMVQEISTEESQTPEPTVITVPVQDTPLETPIVVQAEANVSGQEKETSLPKTLMISLAAVFLILVFRATRPA